MLEAVQEGKKPFPENEIPKECLPSQPSVEEQLDMIRVDIKRIFMKLDGLQNHEHSPHTGRPVIIL